MKDSEIIDHYIIIRETIGYDAMKLIEESDLPAVIKFCTIMYNYTRMKQLL